MVTSHCRLRAVQTERLIKPYHRLVLEDEGMKAGVQPIDTAPFGFSPNITLRGGPPGSTVEWSPLCPGHPLKPAASSGFLSWPLAQWKP